MNYLADLRRFLYRDFIPVTKGTIIISGILFIISLVLGPFGINLQDMLWLNPLTVISTPWTILTYPFVNDILSLIFAALWLWFVGGSLERTWGGKRYSFFFISAAGITGVLMAVVGRIFGIAVPVAGFWIPLVGITWAWSESYPEREVLFWGVIPIKARWLAWIHAALILVTYAQYNLLFGLASVSSILLVYIFQSGGSTDKRRKRRINPRRIRLRVIKGIF